MSRVSDTAKPKVSNLMQYKSEGGKPQPAAKSASGLKMAVPKNKDAKPDMAFKIRLQTIGSKILSAKNENEILISLVGEIANLFNAERITIYVLDGEKRELVSRFKSGSEVKEIRVKVSAESIAGYAAHKQRIINVKDVYDNKELISVDPVLKFDKSWDRKSGFRTCSVLAVPIFFQKYLMGALQLINKKEEVQFTRFDEQAANELAKMIGIGLHNHKRKQRQSNDKFTYLLQNHIITPKELKNATMDAAKRKESLESYLINQMEVPKEDIMESMAKYYEVPYQIYDELIPPPSNLIKGLKVPFMKKNVWVPLRADGDKIIIAVDDPQNFQKIGEIKSVFPNNPLEFVVALKEDILNFISLFTDEKKAKKEMQDFDIDAISDELAKGVEDTGIDEAEDNEMVSEESSAVVKLVNKLITDAYHKRVSDIHIEPQPGKEDVRIRIRIDGACQEYPMSIPFIYRNAIASRIKIMSGLDIAERRKPQDGKIQFKKYSGLDIELRVATVPTQGGMEDIVMRILAAGEPIPLDKMGFAKRNYDEFIEVITKPYGIIFVCGPTGSGKTTTLHSALRYINKVETKIWTAEDPVEITQKGLRQVQMAPKIGLNFASAMRAFLRADPDVIMVGEMRDKETTSIGIEASLTGHLVFTTLHTNSAPESIVRLMDMGMDPFNFADALLAILAQRLVRTLCKHCKEEYHPSKEEYDKLVREYGEEKLFLDSGNPPYSKDLMLFKSVGCEKCNNTGYAGRMGIHELLVGTDEQKRLIQTQARVRDLLNTAIKEGMRTLKQDGVAKIFSGHTDLMQVKKVCIT